MGDMTNYLGWKIDFSQPAGEAALLHPGSVQWRVYKNPIVLGIGGVAAVLLEFADARIRSGVWDHSTYPVDPIGRSKRTGMAAMVGVYGPQSAARRVIKGVSHMHAKVNGQTPGGEAYRALDPELLDWVSATAAYGFLNAYDRFVAPIPDADKARFYRDGAVVAQLYGVQRSPASTADFLNMMAQRADRFEPHPIVGEFLAIIQSGTAAPSVPKFLHRSLARAAVSLLPPLVRGKLALGASYDLTMADRLALRAVASLADRRARPRSPAFQACLRLGLPGNFLYRSPSEQARLLAQAGLAQAQVAHAA
ncbi:oxygenase MpaB family protein [Chelatococcus reniformis]|uniref:Histidine kinase n=1 Tax=Chelatococcus reniformis TaxID=1494448 RepID=A0A916TXG5_9HYPH|nr:oxygenase MpaB family protein [Chelatococcus reniformis]GGC47191.1 histidine kinase [Chelatococcus reniformis]